MHNKKKSWGVALAMGMLLLCSGCNVRELEDRGFPLAVGIDKNSEEMILSLDFPDLSDNKEGKNPTAKSLGLSVEAGAYYEAQKAYENNTNKVLDYNHLKAIVIGQEFLADGAAVRDWLSWLEQEEVVARNTYLFVAQEEAAEILSLTEGAGGSVGNYLEQMVETQEDFKEEKTVTIGDFMNQWHNQNELLLIPVLTDNGGIPSITEYAVVDAFRYEGNIGVEEAMQVFLCQNQLEQFLYHLKTGEIVELQNIRAKTEITAGATLDDRIVVTTILTGDAKQKKAGDSGTVALGWLQKQLNRQLKEELTITATELLASPGMDMSNSFVKLGGYERELYDRYQQDYTGYQKKLDLQFSVDMTVINE